MRVLHVGNIANNGYNNAKFLRRKGIDADVLCYSYTHVMGQPEWEDADFEGEVDEFHPDWDSVDLRGFVRPGWFKQDFVKTDFSLRWRVISKVPGGRSVLRGRQRLWKLRHLLRARAGFERVDAKAGDFGVHYTVKKWFTEAFEGYDIIHANGTDPIFAWLFARQPYVAFEHGTMRDIPFEETARGRLLSVAYRQAAHVFITNPDVISSAKRLGLSNYAFIPHPVDETKYRPQPSPLRVELEAKYDADLILFSPSRHSWEIKGNDRVLRAFARLHADYPRAILMTADWGTDMQASRKLAEELGISDRLVWTPPLNKARLIRHYNAADVILDQFHIGTFGTVTPEAMACEKPVIIRFDESIHDWCWPVMPPVLNATTEHEIYAHLAALAGDPAYRAEVGRAGRAWVVAHHGWERVADQLIETYKDALKR